MKFAFGVAVAFHSSGADYDHLTKERFTDYDSAARFARAFEEECQPTIYFIYDEKYVFYCERSAVKNEPYMLYRLDGKPWGQIETRVWWREFVKNPELYLHLAQGTL